MLAKILHHAGVFMNSSTVTYEDIPLGEALEQDNMSRVLSLIEDRNKAHVVWGLKRPNIIENLPKYLPYFRNPIFVTVFRDILSTAKRNEISMQWPIQEGLYHAAHTTLELLKFIETHPIPNLLVSYEKAIQHPKAFVSALVEHCGLSCDLDSLVTHIEADNPEYLGIT